MTRLWTFLSRLLGSLGRRHDDRELSEDVEAHLELLTADYVRRGLPPHAARAAAKRDFGNVAAMQDVYREQRGLLWMDDVRRDLRHACSSLERHPGFAAVVVLTLGLGIGANTAMFSVVNAVVLRPLTVPDAERLMRSVTVSDGAPMGITDPLTFKVWNCLLYTSPSPRDS